MTPTAAVMKKTMTRRTTHQAQECSLMNGFHKQWRAVQRGKQHHHHVQQAFKETEAQIDMEIKAMHNLVGWKNVVNKKQQCWWNRRPSLLEPNEQIVGLLSESDSDEEIMDDGTNDNPNDETYQGPIINPNTIGPAESSTYGPRPGRVLNYLHLKAQGYNKERDEEEKRAEKHQKKVKMHKSN
eukprot:71196-Ditylum_brightwellii.AAC.1